MDTTLIIVVVLVAVLFYSIYSDIRKAPIIINESCEKEFEARKKEKELHQMIKCLSDDEIIELHGYVKSKLV